MLNHLARLWTGPIFHGELHRLGVQAGDGLTVEDRSARAGKQARE
jgi:hypothetical protein